MVILNILRGMLSISNKLISGVKDFIDYDAESYLIENTKVKRNVVKHSFWHRVSEDGTITFWHEGGTIYRDLFFKELKITDVSDFHRAEEILMGRYSTRNFSGLAYEMVGRYFVPSENLMTKDCLVIRRLFNLPLKINHIGQIGFVDLEYNTHPTKIFEISFNCKLSPSLMLSGINLLLNIEAKKGVNVSRALIALYSDKDKDWYIAYVIDNKVAYLGSAASLGNEVVFRTEGNFTHLISISSLLTPKPTRYVDEFFITKAQSLVVSSNVLIR